MEIESTSSSGVSGWYRWEKEEKKELREAIQRESLDEIEGREKKSINETVVV